MPPADASSPTTEFEQEMQGIGRASLVALLGGIAIGVVGAAFRAGLAWLGEQHVALIGWAREWPWLGWAVPVALGAIGAGWARWMVRREPLAGGSGVQHVEAVTHGEAEPISLAAIPIKFFGGWLGIGTGLALGREGPTIQMGATMAAALSRWFRCARGVMRELQAALGGAGLAVAFNAPIGGALFVFEEVARTFRLRLTVVTLVGTATAVAVARLLIGGAPDFQVAALAPNQPWQLGLYFVFGAVVGALGVLYNATTLFGIDTLGRLRSWPPEARAALVGVLVGGVAWFAPTFVGGGDGLSQQILGGGLPLTAVSLILIVRWFVGPVSYAAGTPGGLFSPLLLVGAALGAVFASGLNVVLPSGYEVTPVAFAVVGMTAFFTGVVRAPFTGIVLIAEMTGTTTQMDAMLAAGFGAMISSSLLRGEPIYDTLRRRMLAGLKRK